MSYLTPCRHCGELRGIHRAFDQRCPADHYPPSLSEKAALLAFWEVRSTTYEPVDTPSEKP